MSSIERIEQIMRKLVESRSDYMAGIEPMDPDDQVKLDLLKDVVEHLPEDASGEDVNEALRNSLDKSEAVAEAARSVVSELQNSDD